MGRLANNFKALLLSEIRPMAHFNRFMYRGLSMRSAVKMSDVRSRANNPGAIIVTAE